MTKRGFVCLQCAMKEFVRQLETGEDPLLADFDKGRAAIWIDDTIENHMRTVHADQAATQRERRDLERRAVDGFDALNRRRAAGIANADNN